ncbi:MAG: hypothetical protein MZV65_17685 [Chromatiales bacterium]|nr:hypothetical protein [Chromatiales bacterium]
MLNRLRHTSAHGIHPPEHKDTADRAIRRFAVCAAADRAAVASTSASRRVPLVRPGQEVVRGEPIAAADGFLSVPIHAPATGVGRGDRAAPRTRAAARARRSVLRPYPGDDQRVRYGAPRDTRRRSTARR